MFIKIKKHSFSSTLKRLASHVDMLKIPRIIIAATNSGAGKTSITCGIIHGIRKKGYSISAFKVGPDYIDPMYLSQASNQTATNLDSWIMGKKEVVSSFVKNSTSDISVIEGVMGFYDGFSGDSELASTYHISTILKAPVILILDASRAARSVAATALGFIKFHKNSHIAGIILNKLGSKKHQDMCLAALKMLKIPVLGCIPKNAEFSLESRHLGLIPVMEQDYLGKKISKMAKAISEFLEIDKIISIARQAPPIFHTINKKTAEPKVTVAVALDKSFNFYYNDNFEALKNAGAKIKFFSPIWDKMPPQCAGIYLGGGFPEVLAGPLAQNHSMKKSIKKLAEQDMPIYAECGGLMYLTKSIHYNNSKYSMVGLLDAHTVMGKKMVLNYTKADVISNCIVATNQRTIYGHEFHYSNLEELPSDTKFAYRMSLGVGIKDRMDGIIQNNTISSYMHVYFERNNFASNFVESCVKFLRR